MSGTLARPSNRLRAVWPLAAAVLPAGFAVAELTDVRAIGGVVLVAGGLATVAAAERADMRSKLAWGAITFAAFVGSHILGREIGSWPAVAVVAVVAGAAGYALLDRQSWLRSPDTREPGDGANRADLRPVGMNRADLGSVSGTKSARFVQTD